MKTYIIPVRPPASTGTQVSALADSSMPATVLAAQMSLQIGRGEVVFIAGPNGVGKSSLIHTIARMLGPAPNAEIFSGHRQIHFTSDDTEQTGMSLEQLQTQMFQHNQNANRFRSAWGEQHLKSVVRRVLNKQNQDNENIVNKSSSSGIPVSNIERENPRIISVINRIFRDSDLTIQIAMQEGILRASRDGGNFYGIDRLSDGERAALLVVGAILVRPHDTVIAIDEPEKHLNPLISSALIARAIRARPDLYFILSSHDLALIEATSPREIIYVIGSDVTRSDIHGEERVFDVLVLPGSSDVPEDIRQSVLGARKPILFVEGSHTSDRVLYKSIFQDHSVVARGGWESVVQSVRALGASPTFHWVKSSGLIDRDGRDQIEVDRLAADHVLSLPAPTIENIYLHPAVLRVMAEKISAMYGGMSARDRILLADSAGRKALNKNKAIILSRIILWKANRELSGRKPSVKSVMSGLKNISGVDVGPIRSAVEAEFAAEMLSARWLRPVYRLPVKNTGVPAAVVGALGYPGFDEFRMAVVAAVEARNSDGLKLQRILRAVLPSIG